jgi:hypothetical protein
MQAPSRRQAVVLYAAQKAEYIWADGLEGAPDKVCTVSLNCYSHARVVYGASEGAEPLVSVL